MFVKAADSSHDSVSQHIAMVNLISYMLAWFTTVHVLIYKDKVIVNTMVNVSLSKVSEVGVDCIWTLNITLRIRMRNISCLSRALFHDIILILCCIIAIISPSPSLA